jgi:type IV pilus assembly protein PilQ
MKRLSPTAIAGKSTEQTATDELSLDEPAAPAPSPELAAPVAETVPVQATEPAIVEAPVPTQAMASSETSTQLAVIKSIRYKANDNGGTVLVEADKPLVFTTRKNLELKQMVLEVTDVVLPKKLQRPLNTRDLQGSIGAIDPYQNSGSSTARFVLQLREGAEDPVVQQEGNTLMIVANQVREASEGLGSSPKIETNSESKILTSQSLSEFLSGNAQFYGKKISIEMDSVDIRYALKLITEESGANLVISDDIKGNVSLKLRQVPWDQALVVLMKTKRLGYSRQGNVLRIATQEQLKQEEEDGTKLALAQRTVEPLRVRMFPVSYAQVAELEKRVGSFLTERGKVVADVRTNSLVVTDIDESLQRVAKLVQNLDIQPPQVLIEGKIVEASTNFTRSIGVNWGASGDTISLGNGKYGPVGLTPTFSINPGGLAKSGGMNLSLALGRMDIFGNLDAALALSEKEDRVKVISSPRIMTLTNVKADISQTTEVPVKQVTAVGNSTQTSISFKPLTLKLEVTPQITSDSSIVMSVKVKREFRGATQDAATESFSVNSREANTTVLVRNGQTAVIGGIYQSDATEGESGVPYLREIPFIGSLFRGRTNTKDKSELLIFLTPRVLAQIESGKAPVADVGVE